MNKMNNKIKNIIFDMNGTMIFDGKYHEIAWKDYAEKLAGRQMSTEEFQHHVLGHTNKDILEYLMGKGTLTEERILELTEEKEAMYREMYMEDTANFKLVDGLVAYLDKLKEQGINMNIATGSNMTNLAFYFKEFDLGRWFDITLCAYDDGTMNAAGAGYIVGIYGDSSRELLEETGLCDELIPDYRNM